MQEVGLNKAEVSTLTRINKEELSQKLFEQEALAVSRLLLRKYPEAPPKIKNFLSIADSGATLPPSFISPRKFGSTKESLLGAAFCLEILRALKSDQFEVEDFECKSEMENSLSVKFKAKTKYLHSSHGRLSVFARYIRRLNAECLRRNIPIVISLTESESSKRSTPTVEGFPVIENSELLTSCLLMISLSEIVGDIDNSVSVYQCLSRNSLGILREDSGLYRASISPRSYIRKAFHSKHIFHVSAISQIIKSLKRIAS